MALNGRRVGSAVLSPQSSLLPVKRKALPVPLWASLLWLLLIRVPLWLVLFVARSPVLLTVFALSVLTFAAYRAGGVVLSITAWLVLVAAFVGVRFGMPAFFEKHVALRLRSRWRGALYWVQWSAAVDAAGLTGYRTATGVHYEPLLLWVRSTRTVDKVRVRMLASQVAEDWGQAAPGLCQTFGAVDLRVRTVPGRPHELELWFLVSDPLVEVVQPVEPPLPVNLGALPVGLREDGERYLLKLLGTHLLLVGATDRGKSSGIWSIVYQLAPAIADGSVRLLGIDPKSSELSFGEALFHRLAWAEPLHYAEVLEEAVGIMRARQARQRGVNRQHVPTPDEPLYVVIIDELAALAYIHDRAIRQRCDYALGLLLSQGRAHGVSVCGCVQDPRKETVAQRDLYPVRIALGLTEAGQVALVHGPEARDQGARADKIPPSMPGVAYVQVDGIPEPIRIRFAHVTDDHIRTLVAGWRPPLRLVEDDSEGAAA